MKKLLILFLLLISMRVFSIDVIIRGEEITQHTMNEIILDRADDGIAFRINNYRLFVPEEMFSSLKDEINFAEDFFTSYSPVDGVIVSQRRFQNLSYLLVLRPSSERIEVDLGEYKLFIYWDRVKSEINKLLQ